MKLIIIEDSSYINKYVRLLKLLSERCFKWKKPKAFLYEWIDDLNLINYPKCVEISSYYKISWFISHILYKMFDISVQDNVIWHVYTYISNIEITTSTIIEVEF